jgi:hypothetical protein
VKRVTLFAVLTFFVQPAIAAPIVSQLLIDRAEKSVLDCLDYSSKVNCDKANRAVANVSTIAEEAYKLTGKVPEFSCSNVASRVSAGLTIYTVGLFIGDGSADKHRPVLIRDISELSTACLKPLSTKK